VLLVVRHPRHQPVHLRAGNRSRFAQRLAMAPKTDVLCDVAQGFARTRADRETEAGRAGGTAIASAMACDTGDAA